MRMWGKCATPTDADLVVGARAEQAPNRDSRVTLDERTDTRGSPMVRLDWKISEYDLDEIERAQRLLANTLRIRGAQLVKTPRAGADGWVAQMGGGAHHMGTTRMHRDATLGVVDEQCRVHGTSNLFVAGSPVFPTGGWAPPPLPAARQP